MSFISTCPKMGAPFWIPLSVLRTPLASKQIQKAASAATSFNETLGGEQLVTKRSGTCLALLAHRL